MTCSIVVLFLLAWCGIATGLAVHWQQKFEDQEVDIDAVAETAACISTQTGVSYGHAMESIRALWESNPDRFKKVRMRGR